MTKPADDLYGAYRQFDDPVLSAVRRETFGEDFGQNSWTTDDEYARLVVPSLDLAEDEHVLEVASGSGGPALHLASITRCRVTGVDVDEGAVATATGAAARAGLADRVTFRVVDGNAPLPFDEDSFDAILCIDAMNHLPDRAAVLREWHRVLRPGRRAVFTDPVVVTGPVTDGELAQRSSIGRFLFVTPDVNERHLDEAGFQLLQQEDVTASAALIAGRWRDARARHRAELVTIEGVERFEGLQRFFDTVHVLSSERRLSRIAYVVEKPAPGV